MENILMAVFEVGSEAYQALSELKQDPYNASYMISQASVVKKEHGLLLTKDAYDSGMETNDDTMEGGIIGALIGILGGPLGILLGGSLGLLIGTSLDIDDTMRNTSMIEDVADRLHEGEVAIIALTQEANEAVLDAKLSAFQNTRIMRWEAAAIYDEIVRAQGLEKEMAKQARKELREERSEERKEKMDAYLEKMKEQFDNLKNKFQK